MTYVKIRQRIASNRSFLSIFSFTFTLVVLYLISAFTMDRKDEPWLKLLTAQERSSSYVSGYVVGREALDNLLRTFYDSTHSSFGVRQSVGESSKNQSLLLSGLVRRQVLWQQSLGDIKIPFDGTPFLVCGRSVVMECQHGARRQPSTCSSSSRKVFQASRKGTCEAVVKYQRVLRFPEHSISTGPTTSAYQLKSMKARAANVLSSFADPDRATASSARVVERYYVFLPTVDAHDGHLSSALGEAAARRSQRVHPELVGRIYDFVCAGIRDAREIRKLLKLEVPDYSFHCFHLSSLTTSSSHPRISSAG